MDFITCSSEVNSLTDNWYNTHVANLDDDDDWHTPLSQLQALDVAEEKKEEDEKEEEDEVEKEEEVEEESSNETLARNVASVFNDKNVKSKLGKHFSGVPIHLMRLRIPFDKNKLYDINDVSRYLKVAYSVYTEASKVKYAKIAKQHGNEIREALAQVSAACSRAKSLYDKDSTNKELKEKWKTLTQQELNLRTELGKIVSQTRVNPSEHALELRTYAEKTLRKLSSNGSDVYAFREALLRYIDPVKYEQILEERREIIIKQNEREKYEMERRHHLRYIDRTVNKFTSRDKTNFEETKQLLKKNKFIPHQLRRYVEIIEEQPYLSFAKPERPAVRSNQFGIREDDFPDLNGRITKSKKEQVSRNTIGEWASSLDPETLRNIPDPVIQPNKKCEDTTQTNICRQYIDEYDDLSYLNSESDDEFY